MTLHERHVPHQAIKEVNTAADAADTNSDSLSPMGIDLMSRPADADTPLQSAVTMPCQHIKEVVDMNKQHMTQAEHYQLFTLRNEQCMWSYGVLT